MPEIDRGSARIHWLVAGRFSAAPRGDSFVVAPAELDAALAARAGTLRVRVTDRLGEEKDREVALEVRSLRSFTLGGVVESVPALRALKALSEKPPATPAEVRSAVEAIAGSGKLAAACAAALEPGAKGAEPAGSGASAALDAFVRSSGGGTPAAPGGAAARRLRDVLEPAIYGTALDVLRAEPVATLEGSWRGLKLLLSHCPTGSDMMVELLDAAPAEVAGAVRARPASEGFDEPDALFVVEPSARVEVLAALADLAEEMLAPCVATAAPALLGAADLVDLAARAERGEKAPQAWEELRAAEPARWLCVAVNPVALFSEGSGAYARAAFGAAAWAVASQVAASYRAQGAFAQVVGKAGALAAPAGWILREGPAKGTRAPTEAFFAISAQRALAAQGLLALGSVQNADRVVLAAAPTASSAEGALPLPAQVLAGRIVRFARWAKAQIDPALPPAEVSSLFEQAASLFLMPRLTGAIALGAQVKGEGAERALRVGAKVPATHALVPLAIEFELPM